MLNKDPFLGCLECRVIRVPGFLVWAMTFVLLDEELHDFSAFLDWEDFDLLDDFRRAHGVTLIAVKAHDKRGSFAAGVT